MEVWKSGRHLRAILPNFHPSVILSVLTHWTCPLTMQSLEAMPKTELEQFLYAIS